MNNRARCTLSSYDPTVCTRRVDDTESYSAHVGSVASSAPEESIAFPQRNVKMQLGSYGSPISLERERSQAESCRRDRPRGDRGWHLNYRLDVNVFNDDNDDDVVVVRCYLSSEDARIAQCLITGVSQHKDLAFTARVTHELYR